MEYISEKPDFLMDEIHAIRYSIQKEYEEQVNTDPVIWYHQQARIEAEKNGYMLIADSDNEGLFKLSKQ
jgi:hypothetical protein